ncbi:hypothetical protein SLE2022_107280 [Rubroshorea leprosula]
MQPTKDQQIKIIPEKTNIVILSTIRSSKMQAESERRHDTSNFTCNKSWNSESITAGNERIEVRKKVGMQQPWMRLKEQRAGLSVE